MTPRLLLASLTLCGVAVLPAYAQDPSAAMPAMPTEATPAFPQHAPPAAESMPQAAPMDTAMQPPELRFRPMHLEPPVRPERPAMPPMPERPAMPPMPERPAMPPMPERPATPAASAEATQPEAQETAAMPQDQAERQQYLDAVREQRRTLMDERSKAWRDASGAARPPMMAPWGDVMRDQMQQEIKQHRAAMDQFSKQRQEEIRAHRYWTNPHSAYINDMNDRRREAMEDMAKQRREQMDKLRDDERRMTPLRPWGMGGPWGYPGW